jgi:hypothetical protein
MDATNNNNNDNNDKKINIIGVNNKYQIKKLTKNKEIKKRKIFDKIDIIDNLKEKEEFYIKNYVDKNIHGNDNEINKLIESEINKKISGYKNQDVIKKKINIDKFINYDYVIQLLYDSNLECYYCKEKVFILYDLVREMKQWSLDRINNDIGHNVDNVIMSCLECNLKRRNINKDAFLFTKELKIIRND